MGDVFKHFAANIRKKEDWGKVPLSIPQQHHPFAQPLRIVYETRPMVDGSLAPLGADVGTRLRAATAVLARALCETRDALTRIIATTLGLHEWVPAAPARRVQHPYQSSGGSVSDGAKVMPLTSRSSIITACRTLASTSNVLGQYSGSSILSLICRPTASSVTSGIFMSFVTWFPRNSAKRERGAKNDANVSAAFCLSAIKSRSFCS